MTVGRGVGYRRQARAPRRERQRGAATTELVLATPALLFMLMLLVQFGLWFHAVHVARAAAQEGARAARVEGGTLAAGEDRARDFLGNVAPRLIDVDLVEATAEGDEVRVEVRGTVIEVVPFLQLDVSGVSQGPVEEFRAP